MKNQGPGTWLSGIRARLAGQGHQFEPQNNKKTWTLNVSRKHLDPLIRTVNDSFMYAQCVLHLLNGN